MSDDLTRSEARHLMAEWEGFTRHPGWALLLEELDEREERAIRAVARGGLTPEQYARLGAEIDLCRRVRLYPTEQAEYLASLLPTEDIE